MRNYVRPQSRKAWLIGVSAAFTLACAIPACDCGGDVHVSNNVTLSFTNPADASIVTRLDDGDATAAGIQKDVVVKADGARDGTTVLLSNSNDVDSTGVPVTVSAQVSGGSVTFVAYTIPKGDVTLHATTQTCDADDCKADAHVSVVDSLCNFDTPKDGDILRQDQYPDPANRFDPFETDIVFVCYGVSPADHVGLSIGDGHPIVIEVDSGSHVVFPKVQLAEGLNSLKVLPRTDASGADPTGTESSANVTVDTGHCIVNLQPGDQTSILAKDDLDSDPTNGMQTRIDVLTDCGTDAGVTLFLKGPADTDYRQLSLTPESRVAEGNQARIRFANVQLPESASPFDVSMIAQVAATSGGKTGTSLPTDYWVDSTVPQLVSFGPGDGSCVGDADPARDGVQINATGHVTGAEPSAEVWVSAYTKGAQAQQCTINDDCAGYDPSCNMTTGCVRCRVNECRVVARLIASANSTPTAQQGDFVANGVTGPAGVDTVKYVVTDLAGNEVQNSVTVSALASAPTVTIPDALNNAQLTAAQDSDTATPGLQYQLQLTTSQIPAGTTGTIIVSGQAPQPFTPVVGTGTTTVTITLQDGRHTIQAVLQDSCGINPSSNTVTVDVDSTPPTITITAYETGGFASRTAIADNGYTKASAVDLDVVVGAGSGSRSLTATIYSSVASGGPTRACSGNAGATATQTLAPTDVGFTFTSLAITEGVNCITVTLTDGANNPSATYVVNRHTSAPAVTITSPTDPSSFTAADDSDATSDGFNQTILAELATPDFASGTVDIELRPVGSDTAFARIRQAVNAGVTAIAFTNASLPGGNYDLVAVYTDQLGNVSTSAPVQLTVSLGAGAYAAITAPLDGATVAGTTSVTVTWLSGSNPTACSLFVDGSLGPTQSWPDKATPLMFTGVALVDGKRVLQARCSDGTNQIFTQAVSVTASSTPPLAPELASEPVQTVGRLDFDTAPSYVSSLTADTSSTPGLQHPVRVLVHTGGLSIQGWQVQLTVTPPGGAPATYTKTLTVGGEPTQVTFDSVDFGSSDGNITFSVVVIDTLSRSSAADSATLIIDRTAPTIALTAPPPTQDTLTRADDQQPASVDSIEVAFQVATTGTAVGDFVSLDISPNPGGVTLPIERAAAGTVTFPIVSFPDGVYAATFTVTDVAGNFSTVVYNFTVRTIDTKVTLTAPTAAVLNASFDVAPAAPGLQAVFDISASGFEAGSEARLCSTTPTVVGQPACNFGGANAGFVIASGSLNGIPQNSSVVLAALIAEGAQVIHVEARELDGDPFVASDLKPIIVDSVPPVVQAVTFIGNDPSNDSGGVIRLNGTEGTPSGGTLSTTFALSIAGIEDGQVVTVFVDGTQVGQAVVNSSLASVVIAIPVGAHTITYAMTDAAGNPNSALTDVVPQLSVEVDFTADSVTLAGPQANPYTSSAGTVSGTDLVLNGSFDIVVTTGDSSGGGTVKLDRFAASSGGGSLETAQIVLNQGQSSASFSAFHLVQGINWLQATYKDRAGNITVGTRIAYKADFIGPTLTLGVRDKNGAGLSCSTFGTACLADTLPVGATDSTVRLDRTGSTPTCGGTTCSTNGTDLFFTLSQCINSDASFETCPITVHLQSRITTGSTTTDWADVINGIFPSSDASATSITTDPQFEPGITRELRLMALDSNNNQSFSPSVFLTLNFDGVAIQVERLDASLNVTGDILANDRYFGIAEDTLTQPTSLFQTNFIARLSTFGSSIPTSVHLDVASGATSTPYDQPVNNGSSGLYAEFVGVALTVATDPASPATNTLTFQAMCGPDPCGPREYSGIVADISSPTYQFDRCGLCALKVPLSGLDCNACAGADSDPSGNIAVYQSGNPSTAASWNLALDTDHSGSDGFNAPSFNVKLTGVENGQQVKLTTDQGTLTNATATSTGCPTAGTCVASFNSLTASNLLGTTVRRISVAFNDKAGNAAVPDAVRGDATRESIYARTDVIPPGGITPIVCIGESTVPASGSDPASVESAVCSTVCSATSSCDRLKAAASLRWTVPGDDDTAGTSAPSGYTIGAAALQVVYDKAGGGTVTYSQCSDITAAGPFELTIPAPTPLQQTGGSEQIAVGGLLPHRDYCFGVFAIDDAGNTSPAGNFVAERKIPLVTYPSVQEFDRHTAIAVDSTATGALYTDPAGSTDFGAFAATLPDLDGDGRQDFAVARNTPGQVLVFLSRSATPTTPSLTIASPTIGDSGAFGNALAGGDFDGDGNNDLIICDSNLATSGFAQAGAGGGALFLYYGTGTSGGITQTTNGTDNQLPSLKPDVALLGRASQHLCVNAAIGDVDGDAKADIVATTNEVASAQTTPRVYGIHGGARSRFNTSANPKQYLDLDADAGSGGPDFSIPGNSTAQAFPWVLALGDYNGDSTMDIAITDPLAQPGGCAACGELYVYHGSASLIGTLPPPQSAGALATTVDYLPANLHFGNAIATVQHPRTTDAADWLLASTVDSTVVVLKGGGAGTGFLDQTYPLATYVTLDKVLWDRTNASHYGRALAMLGNLDGQPGVEIVAGPGFATSSTPPGSPLYTFIYSFDQVNDVFTKRAIVNGNVGFGSAVAGVAGFVGATPADRAQLIVTDRAASQLFLFR